VGYNDFAVSSSGDIYFYDVNARTIQVFDSKMNPKSQFETGLPPFQRIDITDDRVYAMQYDTFSGNQKIITLTTSGKFINTFLTADSGNGIQAISANNGFLAVAFYSLDSIGSGSSIALFSTDGTLKKSWSCENGFFYQSLTIADSNKIYVILQSQTLGLCKIVVYDFQGNKISEKSLQSGLQILDMVFDSQNQRLYIASQNLKLYRENRTVHVELATVYVYDSNFSIAALYNVIGGSDILSIRMQNGSCFIGVSGDYGSTGKEKDRIIKLNPVQR
jgi:hypothetical protein